MCLFNKPDHCRKDLFILASMMRIWYNSISKFCRKINGFRALSCKQKMKQLYYFKAGLHYLQLLVPSKQYPLVHHGPLFLMLIES